MDTISPLIAVVDDEASVRRSLARLLRAAGMRVVTFASGVEFLNTYREHPIDCVVLDLHMAGVGGFDVQASLVRAGKWLPMIVMTGRDTPEARARALAGGFAAFLLKPVDERVLLDAISRAIAAVPLK